MTPSPQANFGPRRLFLGLVAACALFIGVLGRSVSDFFVNRRFSALLPLICDFRGIQIGRTVFCEEVRVCPV